VTVGGELVLVIVLEIADGRISTIRLVANPEKLAYVEAQLA
jgi:hypothetical protein